MNRLPSLVQKSNSVYFMTLNFDGHYVSANDHFLRRFNCNNLSNKLTHIKDTIVEEDWNEVKRVFTLSIDRPGKPLEVTIRKPLPSGEVVHTFWEFMADASKSEIVCIGFDISLRVALSKKTLEFGNRINHIIDSITDGFYSLDKDWNFALANQVFLDSVGLKREELIGRSLWDIFPDDAGYNYPAAYKEAMNKGQAQKFDDYRPDLDKWFWVAAYPSGDGLLVFFKDITERKKEQADLIDSKNKLSAILNSTSEGHMLIDPEYRILSFNRTAFEISRKLYGKKMRHGVSILEFTMPHTVNQFKSDFASALSGKLVNNDVLVEFPKGSTKWLRIELSPALNDKNQIIGVVFNSVDIDELKRYELSLEKSNEQLRAIAFKQSHEMRSPIARIIGLIGLLKESPGDGEIMSHIDEVAKELDIIIHDIISQTEGA